MTNWLLFKMNSFEINKIFAAILITVLIVVGISKISNMIFDKEQSDIVAYKVDAPKDSAAQVKSESSLDLSSFFAAADLAHGEKVFKKCAACHSINKGGKNNIGPALYNVVGRKVGVVADYKYSKALIAYDKEWSFEELNGYLIKPAKWIKGTKMAFAGLRKESDRASVIKYLNENSDNPLPLP